jgi:hypothetical protein
MLKILPVVKTSTDFEKNKRIEANAVIYRFLEAEFGSLLLYNEQQYRADPITYIVHCSCEEIVWKYGRAYETQPMYKRFW